jgi:DNA-binding IclR family transcriptional regulator
MFTCETIVHLRARSGDVSTNGAVKSADRAIDLLELFADQRDGLSLADVCGRTGWPKSSTLALLRTLVGREYLDLVEADGRYRLGHRVAQLGSAYLENISLAREGAEVVREVSRACDETVHLAVLRGRDVLYVAKEEGGGFMRMVSTVGRMIPAHATGVGKMLLSALPASEIDRLYPPGADLPRLTGKTVTDRDAFLAALDRARRDGYATDSGQSTLGVECIAAPVLGSDGQAIAAMSVSVPEPRFSPDRVPMLREVILDGARQLSVRMGCPPALLPRSRANDESEALSGIR